LIQHRHSAVVSPPVAATLLALALSALTSGAALAQQALRGKSVVVSWTEERMQRRQGEGEYRHAIRQGTFSAYVSSTGRIFNRVEMANRRQSGSRDRVGDGPRRRVTLSGRTMTLIQQAQAGGARRIVITFDASFASCTAEVIRGKEAGADKIVGQSLIRPGVAVEIASVRSSGVSCSMRDGNVFGNE